MLRIEFGRQTRKEEQSVTQAAVQANSNVLLYREHGMNP